MFASPDESGRVERNVHATDIQEIADRQDLFPAYASGGADLDNVSINAV
jgi:hypothetical protein